MAPHYSNKNSGTLVHPAFVVSEQGQATAEYVLLLFLTVTIFTLASAKLFTPVKKWTNFYMGQYTYCLIDTGSLPKGVGGDPVECEQLAAQNGYGAEATAEKAKKTAEQMQAEAEAKAKNKALADAQRDHNARKVRGSRGGSRNYSSGRAEDLNKQKAADGSQDVDGSKTKRVATLEKNSRLRASLEMEGGKSQQKSMAIEISGEVMREQEKIMRRDAAVMQISSASEVQELRPRKLKMEPPKRKQASLSSSDDVKFSFGGMLRMAIIGAILVVVVYLVGSQVNTVMKGMDS